MDAKVKKNSTALKSLSEKCQLSRFCDYFVICGLDIENGLEVEIHAGSLIITSLDLLFLFHHRFCFREIFQMA